MKLSIKSSKPLQNFYLEDLQNQKHDIILDTNVELLNGWYELNICYVDTKIEIFDILINDFSIKHLLHTGYYTDGHGKIHQPASAVWDKNGCFKIWIHTDIGVLIQRIYDSIRNGDYGKNLFEKYILTVDKPIQINDMFDNDIKSFFAQADGPNWWAKNDDRTPWLPVALENINKENLLEEFKKTLPYTFLQKDGRFRLCIRKDFKPPRLPFIEIDTIKSEMIQKFLRQIGYKRIIDIGINTQKPGRAVPIHIDDHYDTDAYPYMKGCKKFYWTLQNHENVYFKLGKSGLIPHEKPLLINALAHTHSVVNQGDKVRSTLSIYGEM